MFKLACIANATGAGHSEQDCESLLSAGDACLAASGLCPQSIQLTNPRVSRYKPSPVPVQSHHCLVNCIWCAAHTAAAVSLGSRTANRASRRAMPASPRPVAALILSLTLSIFCAVSLSVSVSRSLLPPLPSSAAPLSSEEKSTEKVVRISTLKTMPECGLDCSVCAMFGLRMVP